MSWASERASIEARLSANWETTAIAYDNVAFEAPNNAAWIRLNIVNGDSGYRALDAKKRHTGVITLQLFAPKNQGSDTLRGYADTLAGVFEDVTFDDIVCRNASITNIGFNQEWHQMNVSIPFWRDEV